MVGLKRCAHMVQLTYVFILEFMCQSHPLRLMFDRAAIHDGMLKLLHDRLVDGIALCSVVS